MWHGPVPAMVEQRGTVENGTASHRLHAPGTLEQGQDTAFPSIPPRPSRRFEKECARSRAGGVAEYGREEKIKGEWIAGMREKTPGAPASGYLRSASQTVAF